MMLETTSLETKRLILEPFSPELLTEKYVSWLNDPLVVQHSRQRHKKHTLEECRQYLMSFSNSDNLFFSIKCKERSNEHIGNITVTVDKVNSVADIAIMIGERNCWGRGYGFEAWKLVCDFLLNDVKIRKVTGGCYSSNKGMQKIMVKSEMQFDGVRKGQVLVDGFPVDLVFYALFNQVESV